jgi:hypothetical protein
VLKLGFFGNRKALSNIWIIVIVSAILLVVLGATVAYLWFWPGNLKTEEMAFADFTGVEVGWAFEVTVTQSSSVSVVISADEKIFDNIEVTQTGNTLIIGHKPGIEFTDLFRKAEIRMPDLNKLILSGATRGTAEGFSNSNTFVLGLSGASSLEMTDINVGDAEIEVSGASNLDAEGTAKDLFSLVSGASNIDLSNFPVNNADIDVSGASRAIINIDGRLDADVSGASALEYIGEPTMGDINTSGSSTIKKK